MAVANHSSSGSRLLSRNPRRTHRQRINIQNVKSCQACAPTSDGVRDNAFSSAATVKIAVLKRV